MKTLAAAPDTKGFQASDAIENFYDIQNRIGHGKEFSFQNIRCIWRGGESCASANQEDTRDKSDRQDSPSQA